MCLLRAKALKIQGCWTHEICCLDRVLVRKLRANRIKKSTRRTRNTNTLKRWSNSSKTCATKKSKTISYLKILCKGSRMFSRDLRKSKVSTTKWNSLNYTEVLLTHRRAKLLSLSELRSRKSKTVMTKNFSLPKTSLNLPKWRETSLRLSLSKCEWTCRGQTKSLRVATCKPQWTCSKRALQRRSQHQVIQAYLVNRVMCHPLKEFLPHLHKEQEDHRGRLLDHLLVEDHPLHLLVGSGQLLLLCQKKQALLRHKLLSLWLSSFKSDLKVLRKSLHPNQKLKYL